MPYAYAVSTVVEGDEAVVLEEAESYKLGADVITFYEERGCVGDRVAFFNWANVVQVTPLTEDGYDEIMEMVR